MNVKQIRGILWKCNYCGFCPQDIECPGFDDDARWESSRARGKIAIINAILQNEERGYQNSNLAKERLFSCTGCAHCTYICPSGIDVPQIITLGKKKLVESGNYPKEHDQIVENIKSFKNPFGEKEARDSLWPELKSNVDAETVYFPGCMAIYRIPELARETLKLFKILEEDIKILENETCCSGILYRTGHGDSLKEIIKPMVDELNNNPSKQIIFTCPGCLTTFKQIYKSELKERFNQTKLLHFTEYLLEKILHLDDLESNIKKLLENEINMPIIWHDPCHLARGLDIYEQPRKILEMLKIPFMEFKQNKEDTNCCGSGSGVRSAYPEMAEKVTLQRLEEVKELRAKTILTSCPFCEYQYSSVIEKYGLDIEVMDLNVFIAKMLLL